MVLWANLHGGFLIGLIIVSIFCGVALLRRDWVNFKIYGFVGVANDSRNTSRQRNDHWEVAIIVDARSSGFVVSLVIEAADGKQKY